MHDRETRTGGRRWAAVLIAVAVMAVLPQLPQMACAASESPVLVLHNEWPSYLGPNGNFSESSGAYLIDDMTKVRLLWESEEKKIGFGKAHTGAGKTGVGKDFFGLPPGGEASPIVAGGMVIMSYFAPTGDVWDKRIEKQMGEKFEKHVWLVAADDVVIAMDAATGRTRWKRVFAGKGANRGAGKRGGWAVTPCAAGGRVFAIGTTGRLYALDLATGEPLWESNIGETHKKIEADKVKALAEGRLVKVDRPYGMLVVVDGVLLAPDWQGGLIGIAAKSGEPLWRLGKGSREQILSGLNAPCPVRVGEKRYVACVNRIGEMRLIDPKAGRVLWTVPLKCEHLTQPVAGNDHLIVFESNPNYREGKQEGINQVGVLAGYRFDEKGAERVWVSPADYAHEMKLDAGPARRVIARDGLIYYLNRSKRSSKADQSDKSYTSYTLLLLRESDGRILQEKPVDAGQIYLWGDRLITVTDIQHRPRAANKEIWQMHTADPADFRALGSGWWVNNPAGRVHYATGGYEVPVYEAFADGLMFTRVMGGIRCYDLRQAPTSR